MYIVYVLPLYKIILLVVNGEQTAFSLSLITVSQHVIDNNNECYILCVTISVAVYV